MAAFILALLLISCLEFVHSQTYLGDSCTLDNGTPGTCKRIPNCPRAQEDIRNGVFPKVCMYDRNQAIVCCVEQRTTTRRPVGRPTTRRTTTRRPTPTTTTTPAPLAVGKSAQKCVEYAEYVYEEEQSPILFIGATANKKAECVQAAQGLIIGGVRAVLNEFPHMTALGYQGPTQSDIAWLCGGSLISERFILTAAHCIGTRDRGKVRWARLGDLNLVETEDKSRPQQMEIVERFVHPNYKSSENYNDIALLRLREDLQLNPAVRPACLHTNHTTPVDEGVIATGWGVLEWTDDQGSADLMKVDLKIASLRQCNRTFQSLLTTKLKRGIQDSSQVCAGDPEGIKDTCVGDSGGPLQIPLKYPYCMYSIVGLTSFGSTACGISASPAVYTRVSHFIPWIESIVWP